MFFPQPWRLTLFMMDGKLLFFSLSAFQLPFFLLLLQPPLAALGAVAFVAFSAVFAGIVVTVAYFKYFH